MHEATFEEGLNVILAKDSRFHREAYLFLRDALDHTQKKIAKSNKGQRLHVTPRELLAGIREFALSEFGPMTVTVLEEWGIRSCEDFGELVFNMVDAGLLAKTDEDSREDFKGAYNFDDVFRKPFLPEDKQERSSADTRPSKV